MQVLQSWPDESAFHEADPRRRLSGDLDFGATWRAEGSNDAHRLGWLRVTGELYLCRADGHDGSCSDVRVLAVLADEAAVDALLDGWQGARELPDGFGWLQDRLAVLAAA